MDQAMEVDNRLPTACSRRNFVALTGTAAALALAGCSAGPSFQTPATEPAETGSAPIYPHSTITWEQRAAALVSRMTPAEKLSQLTYTTAAIPRLGVRAWRYTNESMHGIVAARPVTAFTVDIGLAATWNPTLIQHMAGAISDEARALWNKHGLWLTYRAPAANLAWDPRWGSIEESYGEDPWLASQMACAYVRGMQGDDPKYLKTSVAVKHLVMHGSQQSRMPESLQVDPRSLHEYYLAPFQACIERGRATGVVLADNAINGVPSHANAYLLETVLRNQWGFPGYVASARGGIENMWSGLHYTKTLPESIAAALTAGCDVALLHSSLAALRSTLEKRLISQDVLDRALVRIFAVRYELGEFEPPRSVSYHTITTKVLSCTAHQNLALQVERQAMVLLKNEANFLPLDKSKIKKIAVIGPSANLCRLGMGSGHPAVHITPLAGIADRAGLAQDRIEANTYLESYGVVNRKNQGTQEEYTLGVTQDGAWAEYEGIDFTKRTIFEAMVATGGSGGSIEVRLDKPAGKLLCILHVPHTGSWQMWKKVEAPLARDVKGKHKLYLIFHGDPHAYLFNMAWFRLTPVPQSVGCPQVVYALGCRINAVRDQKLFDEAIKLARESDVAIVVGGMNEKEGKLQDRTSLSLPDVQHELIEAVYQANPKTVLVLVTGCPLAILWENQHLPAIVCGWYGGQAQGAAIADVLFGNYNPAGRLSTTWQKSEHDLPALAICDITAGRTYMYSKVPPLYAFGHGLSYTTFGYGNFAVSADVLIHGGAVQIGVDVANTGMRAGDEVVQLYVQVQGSSVPMPQQQLRGFERISLLPGQTRRVKFSLAADSLGFWDEATQQFKMNATGVEVMVGGASDQIHFRSRLVVKS